MTFWWQWWRRERWRRAVGGWSSRFGPSRVAGSVDVMLTHCFLAGCLFASLTAGAAEPVGRVLYVSTVGDDVSAAPDDPERPFRTIGVALSQCEDGDTVRVGAGTYVVEPGFPVHPEFGGLAPLSLVGRRGVRLEGEEGAEVYGEGRGDFLRLQDCRDIEVRGLSFRGNRPEVLIEPFPFIFPMVHLFGYNSNVVFRSCQFMGFGNHGISHLYDPKASEAVTIEGCLFAEGGDLDADGLGEEGAAVSGIGSGWVITNNAVRDCLRGFEIEGWAPTAVSNVVIRGNVLTNTTNLGIMLFANSGEAWRYRDILIADNQILETRRATNASVAAIWVSGGEGVVVSNNVVRGSSSQGISLDAFMADVVRARVVGNVVEGAEARGLQVYQHGTYRVLGAVVTGNEVRLNGDSGILVEGNDILVKDNVVEDNAATSLKAGIRLTNVSGQAGRMTVLDNRITSGHLLGYQDYGIMIEPGVNGAVVVGNAISAHPGGEILDFGSGTDYVGPEVQFVSISLGLRDRFTVRLAGAPGWDYVLEASDDWQEWVPVASLSADEAGSMVVERVALRPARFYRVVRDGL